jgi:hypothetical protein
MYQCLDARGPRLREAGGIGRIEIGGEPEAPAQSVRCTT